MKSSDFPGEAPAFQPLPEMPRHGAAQGAEDQGTRRRGGGAWWRQQRGKWWAHGSKMVVSWRFHGISWDIGAISWDFDGISMGFSGV